MIKHKTLKTTYKKRFGDDINKAKMYRKFTLARCQAKYWNQIWDLEFEDYYATYEKAGIKATDIGTTRNSPNLTRIDTTKGWSVDNIKIAERSKTHNSNHMDPRFKRTKLADAPRKKRHYKHNPKANAK